MSDICSRCDGCGQIANSDDGEPWTAWISLPEQSQAAIKLGLVKPIPCPACTTHDRFPKVQGRCPACKGNYLFVGAEGYITCSRSDCPDPEAATKLLLGET